MKKHVSASLYQGYRFPGEIIGHGVWLYFRFSLSFRDVEELMAERGGILTYETIRQGCVKFGQTDADRDPLSWRDEIFGQTVPEFQRKRALSHISLFNLHYMAEESPLHLPFMFACYSTYDTRARLVKKGANVDEARAR